MFWPEDGSFCCVSETSLFNKKSVMEKVRVASSPHIRRTLKSTRKKNAPEILQGGGGPPYTFLWSEDWSLPSPWPVVFKRLKLDFSVT